jgi:outer membrane murein-binding lipoprotein Lpp
VAAPNDDLEARVTALETQIRLGRADAAAARVLAGGVDRDVSALAAKLDAHTRVLNALRETQLEQGMAIGGLTHQVDGLTHQVDGLTHRMDGLEHEMRQGFAMMATGMARITALLEGPGGSEPD